MGFQSPSAPQIFLWTGAWAPVRPTCQNHDSTSIARKSARFWRTKICQWYPDRWKGPTIKAGKSVEVVWLGGGFKHVLFSPNMGKVPILNTLGNMFQRGWNHHLDDVCLNLCFITFPKTNMTMEKYPPFEDVFPYWTWGFSYVMLVFGGVCWLYFVSYSYTVAV